MHARNGGDRPSWPVRTLHNGLRGLRRLFDRTVHTVRRRTARGRLRSRPFPPSIVFICHGNVCRSPYAEAVVRQRNLLQSRNTLLRSAGFVAPGQPSPPEALAAAARRRVDLGGHRSRLLNTAELAPPALVVVMTARQQRTVASMAGRPRRAMLVLGDLDPESIDARGIRDPLGASAEVFDAVYERIDRCVGELARVLNEGRDSDGGAGTPPIGSVEREP